MHDKHDKERSKFNQFVLLVSWTMFAPTGLWAGPGESESNLSGEPRKLENLLPGGSFENGIQNWHPELDVGWTQSKGVDGSAALVVERFKPPDHIIDKKAWRCTSIDPDHEYVLTADVKVLDDSEGRPSNRLEVNWFTSQDCSTGGGGVGSADLEKVDNWQRIYSRKLEPSLNARSAEIMIRQYGSDHQSGTTYWDNVGLYAVGPDILRPDENILRNPGFRRRTDHWNMHNDGPSRWTDSSGRDNPGAIRALTQSTSGGAADRVFEQCVSIGDTPAFDAGISFRRDPLSTAPGGGVYRVFWYEHENCTGRNQTFTDEKLEPRPGYGWQDLKFSGIQVPDGATSAKVQVIASIQSPGKHIGYWDDAFLVPRLISR